MDEIMYRILGLVIAAVASVLIWAVIIATIWHFFF
jgi:hypothetical protein